MQDTVLEQQTWGEEALATLFGSDVRARIIAWLCGHAADLIIAREVARELDLPATTVNDELGRLEALGLIQAGKRIGVAKPYMVNEASPLLPGLRAMVQYAVGAIALLREALGRCDGIDVAFVFGSVARRDDNAQSDIDLMVIGEISGRELSSTLGDAERQTGREVNPVHYSPDEFRRRAGEGGSFLESVQSGPKVFVKGDEDALRKLAR